MRRVVDQDDATVSSSFIPRRWPSVVRRID